MMRIVEKIDLVNNCVRKVGSIQATFASILRPKPKLIIILTVYVDRIASITVCRSNATDE